MAKARVAAAPPDDALKRDLIAVALATAGALILASLLYRGEAMGVLPSRLAWGLRTAVGLGAYAVPCCLLLIAGFYGFGRPPVAGRRVILGSALLTLSLLVLLQLRANPDWRTQFENQEAAMVGGGYVGAGMAYALLRLLGLPGAYILVVGLFFTGLILLTRATVADMLGAVGDRILRGAGRTRDSVRQLAQRPGMSRTRRPLRRLRERRALPPPKPDVELDDPLLPPAPALLAPSEPTEPVVLHPPAASDDEDIDIEPPTRSRGRRGAGRGSARGRGSVPASQAVLLKNSDLFALPSVSMLTAFPDEVESAQMREEAAEQIIKLEDTLASFGISAKVTHYERGPVLTRYEVEPERGIRVNQVVRLADDLAMALAAVDVRVEAPIPGKSAIGIEVPNETRATVSLRGLLELPEYQEHPSKLAIALGRDIAGQPVIADIATMPHLLIAGATGSGKSVCLHSTIVSLLMRATPDDVRFIMVDPKRVELAVYDGIPHLLAPVVHSVKQAADVLRKAIREMEKRYDKFALKGVVNLAEYNALAAMPKERAIDEFDPLPHVVIIIDELADLMMQSRAEFEFSICRIAQLARATGIHLVLATQRPSVKVVTGNIKANVPTRIALAVASQHDSRTILDGQGAERLIGRGDMLYAPLDASKPRRVQGAFVPREDIERVVEHLRSQGEPEFQIIPEVPEDEQDYADDLEASDDLYAAAVQYVIQEQEASVSMLQRRFKVGYARAGRLIDMMEQRGVVGPHEGSRPRQVYISPHAAEALLHGRHTVAHGNEASRSADDDDKAEEGLPGLPALDDADAPEQDVEDQGSTASAR